MCLTPDSLRKALRALHKEKEQKLTGKTPHEIIPAPIVEVLLEDWDKYDWKRSSDALADWENSRWTKTGFKVSREAVCFTLRLHGRDAVMGLGDHLDGAYKRV